MNLEIASTVPAPIPAGAPARPAASGRERPCSILKLRYAPDGSPHRANLEHTISARFESQYGARVAHFFPALLSLDVAGVTGAIAGLRFADTSALFLEHYLDAPVEQVVGRHFGQPVERSRIAEIGNLVSLAPGAGLCLFALLPLLLDGAGIDWVACTATPQVRRMISKLGFPTRPLAEANPAALGDAARDWGTYYEARPMVIAGNVNTAASMARQHPDTVRLQSELKPALQGLADMLRASRS